MQLTQRQLQIILESIHVRKANDIAIRARIGGHKAETIDIQDVRAHKTVVDEKTEQAVAEKIREAMKNGKK